MSYSISFYLLDKTVDKKSMSFSFLFRANTVIAKIHLSK